MKQGVARLGYVPALDGLRGIAITLVVCVHFFGLPLGGVHGVDLFFVLSGFLISTLLLEERAATGRVSLRSFYARRARRLLPALAAMLIAFIALGGAIKTVALGGLYFGNVVQEFGLSGPVIASPLTHLWSLAEEEQFYLVWPILLFAVLRARRPLRLLAITIAILACYRAGLYLFGAPQWRVYFGPDVHADGLLAGTMLAIYRRLSGLNAPEWVGKASGAILLVAVILRVDGAGWWAFALPIVELACVGLVATAVSNTEFAGALTARPLVWLGQISYSLYVWHLLVLSQSRGHTLLFLPLAVAVAWISYKFIEQPFRKRRKAVPAAKDGDGMGENAVATTHA